MSIPDEAQNGRNAESCGERFGRKDFMVAWLIACGALLLRAFFLSARAVLQGDEIHYAESLFSFLHGRFLDGISDYWSFLYPFAAIPFGAAAGAEAGLRWLSIVSGTAVVILVIFIAVRIFDRRSALIAGLMVALHPNLVAFSTGAMTEPFYSFLLVSALAFFLIGSQEGKMICFVFSGALVSLSSLVRPESMIFLFFFAVAILAARGVRGLASSPVRRLLGMAAMIAAAIAVMIPYLVILKEKTGDWTLGSKASVNLSSPLIWEDNLEREKFVYSLDSSGKRRQIEEIGKENSLAVLWRERSRIARSYLPKINAGFSLVPLLFSSPLLLLIVPLGIAGRAWRKAKEVSEFMLLAVGFFPFLFYSIFRVELRYLVPYLPIHLIWAGVGCSVLADRAKEIFDAKRIAGTLTILFIAASLLPYTFHKYSVMKKSQEVEWRAIGSWIGANFPGKRILAHSGCPVSYYAGNPQATFIPWTDSKGLSMFARENRYELVVFDERYIKNYRPLLDDMLSSAPPEFETVGKFEYSGRNVLIFRLEPLSE